MTAILGYANGEHVWMGGDSRGIDGWTPSTLTERKVFCIGDLLIGGSGILRHLQIIRLRFQLPDQAEGESDERYICVRVMDALAACLKEAATAFSEEENGATTALLIGYHGALYYVSPKLCADRPAEQVGWLGSGGEIAFGAFAAYRANNANVEWSMLRAFEIAEKHNLTVGAPFFVEKL